MLAEHTKHAKHRIRAPYARDGSLHVVHDECFILRLLGQQATCSRHHFENANAGVFTLDGLE